MCLLSIISLAVVKFSLVINSSISSSTGLNPYSFIIASTIENLKVNRWKGIKAEEETGKTSREGVFAGVAAVNIILVLFVDEHRYNKDWKVVQKKCEKVAAVNVNA